MPFRRISIAGTNVSAISYERTVEAVRRWAESQESRYVCVCPANGVVTGWLNHDFRTILNQCDILTPDGVPIVWTLRLIGARRQRRVYGPTLMLRICQMCEEVQIPIFLYGSTERTLSQLQKNLLGEFPNLTIAGIHSPPYRVLSAEEDEDTVRMINQSGARVVFVGLGLPKQERWMHNHLNRIRAVMIGVGAAFDFHSGAIRQAPSLMQRAGLEWCFRLLMEPRRLWWRYLRDVPIYTMLAVREIVINFLRIGKKN